MLYVATFESRNFTFEGCDTSEARAKNVLVQAMREHGRQYGLEGDWWLAPDATACATQEEWEANNVNVRALEQGGAYRDREPI